MVQNAAAGRSIDRAEGRRRQILEAASRVFRRRGLHAAGMREIAAEIGMRAGNLYYYFDSKQELLAYCQEETLASLLELAAAVGEQGLRPDVALYRLIEGHVVRLNEDIPGSLAHIEIEALEPDRRAEILAMRDRYEEAYRDHVQRGVREGRFRAVDAKLAAMALLGAANWTVKWYRPDGELSATEIGRRFADVLVRGLLAPGVELETV